VDVDVTLVTVWRDFQLGQAEHQLKLAELRKKRAEALLAENKALNEQLK
jgi:hypothetical protein